MKGVVAVVSYPKDTHARYVKNVLTKMKIPTIIIDFGAYPAGFQSSVRIDLDVASATFNIGRRRLRSDQIIGVWWRRPLGEYQEGSPSMLEKYVKNEADAYLAALPEVMNQAVWVSDANATKRAGCKPYQLLTAKRIGLQIPASCIGNSARDVAEFIRDMGKKKIIVKAAANAFVRLNRQKDDLSGANRVIYTQIIEPARIMDNIDLIPNCPFIVQELIEKEIDIRVTVVGNKAFSAGIIIDKHVNDDSNVDWRRLQDKRIYVRHDLPEHIQTLCIELTKNLGLAFGCIDLAYSKERGYVFFEINPQGQWLPSEKILGYPISEMLVELLSAKKIR